MIAGVGGGGVGIFMGPWLWVCGGTSALSVDGPKFSPWHIQVQMGDDAKNLILRPWKAVAGLSREY